MPLPVAESLVWPHSEPASATPNDRLIAVRRPIPLNVGGCALRVCLDVGTAAPFLVHQGLEFPVAGIIGSAQLDNHLAARDGCILNSISHSIANGRGVD